MLYVVLNRSKWNTTLLYLGPEILNNGERYQYYNIRGRIEDFYLNINAEDFIPLGISSLAKSFNYIKREGYIPIINQWLEENA